MGKLIVVEGLDGSGKSTQIELIKSFFEQRGTDYRQIKLPDYENRSSTLVKMYLAGDFGTHPDDVNAYASSSFYAVDRYASFARHWGADYKSGKVILADRYTTSNAVHQTAKLPRDRWDDYLDWLYDFEFGKLQIPSPDLVLYLDMHPAISQRLMSSRYHGDEQKKDIHERDVDYLLQCRKAALYSAKRLGWCVITCFEGDNPLPVKTIADKIRQRIEELL